MITHLKKKINSYIKIIGEFLQFAIKNIGEDKIVQNGQTEPKLCLGLPEGVLSTSRGEVCS